MCVLPSFAGGGAERVMLNLLAGLDRDGFDPSLIVLDGRGPLAHLAPADVAVHDLATPRLRQGLRRLICAIRTESPDALVSTFGHVNMALLACRGLLPKDTRIIARDANLPSLSLPSGPHPKLMKLAYRLLSRRADIVLCSSARMAEEFAADFGVPRAKLEILPNPIAVAAMRKAAMRPVRQPGPGQRFVAAGRLTSQKGFDRLIDLFARAKDEAHLTIVGEGKQRAALEARAASLHLDGRVIFEGFDPAPWPLYAGADAFLLPSRWEGMPNAALEALACGTPVVATPESGGMREIAADAGPAAIHIAAFGDEFLTAMDAIDARPPVQTRPSLLPDRFDLPNVCRQFESILTKVA